MLVSRGTCTFVSKAERAEIGGAIGIILVDNRFGEANQIPIPLPLPAGMISDLDGAQLRAFADANGGQATIRVTSDIREIQTGRAGVITSFSSAGPTDFGHMLKPDISAPGLDVLSSTPPKTTGGDVRSLRRHVDGDTARRGRGRAAPAAASGLDAVGRQVRTDVDGGPRLG